MFTVKLIDVTFIHLISELAKTVFSLQNVEISCEFYYKYTFVKSFLVLWVWKFQPHFAKETGGNQWINAALNPLCLDKVPHLTSTFRWKKDKFYSRCCNKQTNKISQLQNMHFEFTYTYFIAIQNWLSSGKSAECRKISVW